MSELEDIWHRTPEDRHSDEIAELESENARLREKLSEQARLIDAQEKLLKKISNLARKLWEIAP